MSPAYGSAVSQGSALAAIVWPGADWQSLGLKAAIVAPRARLAMARLTQMLDQHPGSTGLRHSTAVIAPSATVAQDADVGAFSIIGEDVTVGPGARVAAHVTIGAGARIGVGCVILEGARIGPRVILGDRVIVHPNAVIGADGFSFVTQAPSNVERARATLGTAQSEVPQDPTWHKIHSLGSVVVGDDVEIGANSTVDAGTIRPTRIGDGTKIDNLVQVGHNVVIGRHCLLCAQAAVAGSTVIGDRVVLGGRAAAADNITIGSDAVLSGGTVALSNVPAGRVMMGYPAVRMETHIESYKALRRLPRILRDLGKLTKSGSKQDRE
jgi:UDP-3-O-[3-hydroxymyristoyl] glucosamine N-acyltransferase